MTSSAKLSAQVKEQMALYTFHSVKLFSLDSDKFVLIKLNRSDEDKVGKSVYVVINWNNWIKNLEVFHFLMNRCFGERKWDGSSCWWKWRKGIESFERWAWTETGKLKLTKWQVNSSSWKYRNIKTGDTGLMWVERCIWVNKSVFIIFSFSCQWTTVLSTWKKKTLLCWGLSKE